MADLQTVHHRQPYHNPVEEEAPDHEKSQYSDKVEDMGIIHAQVGQQKEGEYSDTSGITPGDPFPEDPLIPHEEHTLTLCEFLVLRLRMQSSPRKYSLPAVL